MAGCVYVAIAMVVVKSTITAKVVGALTEIVKTTMMKGGKMSQIWQKEGHTSSTLGQAGI